MYRICTLGASIDDDQATGTYCATYHYPSQPPSTTVALALMEIVDSWVTDLTPLYETVSVNADALDDLIDSTTGQGCQDRCVTFIYHDTQPWSKVTGASSSSHQMSRQTHSANNRTARTELGGITHGFHSLVYRRVLLNRRCGSLNSRSELIAGELQIISAWCEWRG